MVTIVVFQPELMWIDVLMKQLTLWTSEPATPQVQIPNPNQRDLLHQMAQLLLEVVIEPLSESERIADDE